MDRIIQRRISDLSSSKPLERTLERIFGWKTLPQELKLWDLECQAYVAARYLRTKNLRRLFKHHREQHKSMRTRRGGSDVLRVHPRLWSILERLRAHRTKAVEDVRMLAGDGQARGDRAYGWIGSH